MHFLKKLLLLMHFTAFLILFACLTASATGYTQKVTVDEREADLATIFAQITQQTGYTFTYAEKLLPTKKLAIKITNEDLDEALKNIFHDLPLEFTIVNTTIVVRKKRDVKQGPQLELEAPPVKGIVRGPDGQPLAGVNIVVKGTSKGTSSAGDGSFSIEAKPGDKLVISSIGYASQEITVTNSENIFVGLQVSNSPLDEVQIIAYGETSKRLQTGNVSSVKAKDIEKQPVQNPLLALQGRVPGITIEQATGLPGSGIRIRVQGQNSILSGNDPLYVIDGMQFYSQLLPSLSNVQGVSAPPSSGGAAANPLNFINPLDIVSIEILKDADATAIYGSRGANGVVLINTKKGQAGNLKTDFNIQQAWATVGKKIDLLNTPQYLEMRREAYANDGSPIPDNTSPKDLSNYDLTVWDPNRYTDWQEELIGGTAQYQNAQVSLSGGSSQTQYMISGTFHRETTVFPGDLSNKKGSINFNLNTSSPNKKLTFQANLLFQLDDNRIIPTDLTAVAMRIPPNAPSLYHPDGSLNWEQFDGNSTWKNPLSDLTASYNTKTSNLLASATVNYRIFRGLSIKVPLGFGNLVSDEKLLFPLTGFAPETRSFESNGSSLATSISSFWQVEPQLIYNSFLGGGNIDVLIGTSFYNNSRKRSGVSGSRFSSDLLLSNPALAENQFALPLISNYYKYNALFSRLNYNWRNKYILNLNVRRDGSSRFGAGNQFHNFGSVGAAWIVSNENFMKQLYSVISFTKLRFSYGSTGSDQIGDYQFMALYQGVPASAPFQGIQALAPNKLNNPYLQWEETRKLSASIELGLIRDRIIANATYYRNRSSNQLIGYTLPAITGFTTITQNFPAIVENTGIEFEFQFSNISSKSFTWNTNINFTIPKNKVREFKGIEKTSYASGTRGIIVGYPLDTRKFFNFLGVDPATGLFQYTSTNPDEPVSNTPNGSNDRIVAINSSFPKYYGGISNSLIFKSFELDFLFQFVKQSGVEYFGNFPGQFTGYAYTVSGNQPVQVLDRWKKPGDNARFQKFSSAYPGDSWDSYGAFGGSDVVYVDASYIRLKNLSFGYKIPKTWLSKITLHQAKLFCQAQNVLTITNYDGLDPETRSSTALPPLRVITVGLNVTL